MSESSVFLAPWWELPKVKKKNRGARPPNIPIRKVNVPRVVYLDNFNLGVGGSWRGFCNAVQRIAEEYGIEDLGRVSLDIDYGRCGYGDDGELAFIFASDETEKEYERRYKIYESKLEKWKEKERKYAGSES